MQRSFRSFIKNGKERKESSVLLWRTEQNAKSVPFFWKERIPNPGITKQPNEWVTVGKYRVGSSAF